MTPLLIAVAVTVAAATATWFFCMRPMLRRGGAAGAGCCPVPKRNIEAELRTTRRELQRLQQAGTPTQLVEPRATTPPGREAQEAPGAERVKSPLSVQ